MVASDLAEVNPYTKRVMLERGVVAWLYLSLLELANTHTHDFTVPCEYRNASSKKKFLPYYSVLADNLKNTVLNLITRSNPTLGSSESVTVCGTETSEFLIPKR